MYEYVCPWIFACKEATQKKKREWILRLRSHVVRRIKYFTCTVIEHGVVDSFSVAPTVKFPPSVKTDPFSLKKGNNNCCSVPSGFVPARVV